MHRRMFPVVRAAGDMRFRTGAVWPGMVCIVEAIDIAEARQEKRKEILLRQSGRQEATI